MICITEKLQICGFCLKVHSGQIRCKEYFSDVVKTGLTIPYRNSVSQFLHSVIIYIKTFSILRRFYKVLLKKYSEPTLKNTHDSDDASTGNHDHNSHSYRYIHFFRSFLLIFVIFTISASVNISI